MGQNRDGTETEPSRNQAGTGSDLVQCWVELVSILISICRMLTVELAGAEAPPPHPPGLHLTAAKPRSQRDPVTQDLRRTTARVSPG